MAPFDADEEKKIKNSTLTRPLCPSFSSTPSSDVCIIGAVRTPIGGLMGSLSSLSATQLGGQAIAAALRAARIEAASEPSSSAAASNGGGGGGGNLDVVDEVIMGNVLSAGLGQVRIFLFLSFISSCDGDHDLSLKTLSPTKTKKMKTAGPGHAGRHLRRTARDDPGLHRQQGLRLRHEGRRARRGGDLDGRGRARRRGRHGVDEQRAFFVKK